jgi:hypothetical protein
MSSALFRLVDVAQMRLELSLAKQADHFERYRPKLQR